MAIVFDVDLSQRKVVFVGILKALRSTKRTFGFESTCLQASPPHTIQNVETTQQFSTQNRVRRNPLYRNPLADLGFSKSSPKVRSQNFRILIDSHIHHNYLDRSFEEVPVR